MYHGRYMPTHRKIYVFSLFSYTHTLTYKKNEGVLKRYVIFFGHFDKGRRGPSITSSVCKGNLVSGYMLHNHLHKFKIIYGGHPSQKRMAR